jgi:predicted DNA repair protein MutK
VDVTTNGTGVIGLIQTVAANEEVQAIGKTILDGVPALMSALETLTEVHPFLKGNGYCVWFSSILTCPLH